MLDQFLAKLRDSDLVVPVFLFFLLPSMRKQELSSGERWPRAKSYVPSTGWLVKKIIFSKTLLTGLFDVYSWGKASAARKMTAKKKIEWLDWKRIKEKKREEKASHHQHIFNKRNKFTKIYRDFYVLSFRQRSQKYSRSTWSYLRSDADEFVSFQIILIAACNCSSLHTLCSYIYSSTQPIHLFQFHFHPDAVCITIVYSLNYRTYRAQLMFRRLTSVKSQLLRRQHAIHPFLPYIYFRLTALDYHHCINLGFLY